MTTTDHFAEALHMAAGAFDRDLGSEARAFQLCGAQVHATLAVAQALRGLLAVDSERLDAQQWEDVADVTRPGAPYPACGVTWPCSSLGSPITCQLLSPHRGSHVNYVHDLIWPGLPGLDQPPCLCSHPQQWHEPLQSAEPGCKCPGCGCATYRPDARRAGG